MGGLPLKGSSSTVTTAESQPNQGSAITTSVPESKLKKKICCACPETKKLRDECMWSMVKSLVPNGLRLIVSAFVLRALMSQISSCLMVRGKVVFTEVPQNVVVSLASPDSSAFIGATSTTQSSRHVFSLGFLEKYKFYVCSDSKSGG